MSKSTTIEDVSVSGRGGGDSSPTGPVLIARRDVAFSPASDLSNVVAFAPRRRGAAGAESALAITGQDRAVLPTPPASLAQQAAMVVGSILVHCSILFVLWQSPPPLASIGIEAITVDVVLGANSAAGTAAVSADSEVAVATPAPENAPEEQPAEEQGQVATEMPQDVPVAANEAAPEPVEEKPEEQRPETQTQAASIETPPVETQTPLPRPTVPDTVEATVMTEPPSPPVQPEQRALERKRVAAPTKKAAVPRQQAAAAAPAAASGVGRGRSDNSANYNGRVSAHLTRHKQYPAAARSAGSQGTATVSFSLDGGGRVTAVRLARSSGIASIDAEAVAMVRRANPFPAPPDGRGRNFTVPVRFNLR